MKETGALPSSSLHSSVGDKPVNQTQYSTADANEGACGAWETGEGFPEETLLEPGSRPVLTFRFFSFLNLEIFI